MSDTMWCHGCQDTCRICPLPGSMCRDCGKWLDMNALREAYRDTNETVNSSPSQQDQT